MTSLLPNHLRRGDPGMRRIRKLTLLITLMSVPLVSRASNFTLPGIFTADDNVQLFSVSLTAPAAVDFRTYAYGGGTTSTATVIAPGGFDTILTLFSASGVFIDANDDGMGANVDRSTGMAGDARITANLAAGSYILALTQYDNFSLGALADGFAETGHPNFTADPSFTTGGACAGNLFRDISGTAGRCRTGNWTVDFVNVASVSPLTAAPEPSALLLAGLGLILLLISRFRHWTKASTLAGVLVTALASLPAHAQTTSSPDYSNVSDILNGQRTLLPVTDIMINLYDQKNGRIYSTPITYSNSQPATGNQFSWATAAKSAGPSFSALMWNGPATNITVVNGDVNNAAQKSSLVLLFQTGTNTANWQSFYPFDLGDNPNITSGAAADFTGDGFDDLALSTDDGRLLVMTPRDVNYPLSSFNENVTSVDTLRALAAGDFKGDGGREIAGLSVQQDGGLKLVIYTVDPNTLAVTPAPNSLTLRTPGASASSPITFVSMARGRFTNTNHDQLAVGFAVNSGPAYIDVIDFTPSTLTPYEASPQLGSPSNTPMSGGFMQVFSGKFNLPNSLSDSIVYHSSTASSDGRFFEVVTVDSSFNLTGHTPVTYNQVPCASGIHVGNFDHRQGTGPNLNSQVALLFCNGETDSANNLGFSLHIYSVDPSTSNLSGPDSGIDLTGALAPDNAQTTFPSFAATDLQGRSLTLGEPKVVDIDNMDQPTVVVAGPPMHVDFVSPDGTSGPELLNLSVVPDSFNNTYQSDTSVENPQTTSHTSSWSFGALESFGAKIAVGDVKGGTGYSVGDKVTAAQQFSQSIDNTYGSFMGQKYSLTNGVGLDDYLAHNETILRVWVYPVIGQTVCPSDKTCPPDAEVPLTIQFSAPLTDNAPTSDAGTSLSWYQPPWEPGNIFSYPANLTQLQNMYQGQGTCPGNTTTQNSTLCTLARGNQFGTNDVQMTATTTWTVTSSTATTTSFNQNYSFENDLSVAGSVGKAGVVQAQFTGEFDLSGSYGYSTLTNNSTTLGESTGLEVQKPGTLDSTYRYYVTPYILGTTIPGGVVDNKPLSGSVQTFGVMRSVFTVDPLANGSLWWTQVYGQAPDVALNHPQRWKSQNSGSKTGDNCVGVGGSSGWDCVRLATPKDPANPGLDLFHTMRGFFISTTIRDNSGSCNAVGGQAPQLESAIAGDCVYLQARVYNYSLKPMDPNTVVHVRFYFTPWSNSTGKPAANSVLIADVATGQLIPPFDTGEDAPPNWILVPAKFDTNQFDYTKNGDVDIRFWAIVWMDDGNGTLVSEMPGHGLTGIPGTLNSLADAANLEQIQSDGNSYSNNVGFYNQNFHIFAPQGFGAPAPLPPPPPSATVDIGKLGTSIHRVTSGDNVVLSGAVSASGAALGINIYFYDGDPKKDGRVFASERIPYIAADTPHQVQAVYRSNTCGMHQLFAVVNRGRPSEVVRRAQPVQVDCKGK